MSGETYNVIHGGQGVPIKAWTKGVQLEDQAVRSLYTPVTLRQARTPTSRSWP